MTSSSSLSSFSSKLKLTYKHQFKSALWTAIWDPSGSFIVCSGFDQSLYFLKPLFAPPSINSSNQSKSLAQYFSLNTINPNPKVFKDLKLPSDSYKSLQIVEAETDIFLSSVRQISWRGDNSYFAAGCFDSKVYIYGFPYGKKLYEKSNSSSKKKVISLGFSSESEDSLDVYSSISNTTVTNLNSIKPRIELATQIEGHRSEIKCVDWNSKGDKLTTCSRDKTIWVWDVFDPINSNDDNQQDFSDDEEIEFECNDILHGHTQDVKTAYFHPTDDRIISSSSDCLAIIWSSSKSTHVNQDSTWNIVAKLNFHKDGLVSALWSPKNGNRVLTAAKDGKVVIWHQLPVEKILIPEDLSENWGLPVVIHTSNCPITAVTWSMNQCIIVADAEGMLYIYKTAYDSSLHTTISDLLYKQRVHSGKQVNSIQFHPKNSQIFITSGDDRSLCFWYCDMLEN